MADGPKLYKQMAKGQAAFPQERLVTKFRAFLTVFAASLAVMIGGMIGYTLIEGVSLFDALYMTVITVTTIGYGEIFPLSTAGKVFTMLLAFSGVGIILITASEVARVVLDGDLRRLFGLPREVSMIKRMSDHIVVAGLGRMGRSVVETLEDQGVPFVVVDLDIERLRPLVEERKAAIHGDATHQDTLQAAGIERARTFIASLRDDAHNVYAILLARQLNPGINVIARAVEEDAETRLRLAGAHRVINPYRLGGVRLAHTALKPSVVEFLEESLLSSGVDVELAEVKVGQKSDLDGLTLAATGIRQKYGVIVVALKRDEESIFNPAADTRIAAGDVMIVLGPVLAVARLVKDTAGGGDS